MFVLRIKKLKKLKICKKIVPKEHTKCKQCVWSYYLRAECVLASGYICKLNPFKSIAMGLSGTYKDRKDHIQSKREEYKEMD